MIVNVIGGGGHAKVVIATLQGLGHRVNAVYDDDSGLHGQSVLGIDVVGPVEAARHAGMPSVVAIGNNAVRQRVVGVLEGKIAFPALIHPSAWVHESVQVGPGSVVFAGAVVQPDTMIGEHCIVNTGATVDHDCLLFDYVHVAPGANLAGDVTLEEGVLIGIGAAVIPGTSIGARSTVAAGSVVVRDVAPDVTVAGIPARSVLPR